jgi:hypothetical protein
MDYAREPRKLASGSSAAEVARFLEAVSRLKVRVALTAAYAEEQNNFPCSKIGKGSDAR